MAAAKVGGVVMSSKSPRFYRWRRASWREEKTKQLVAEGPTIFMVASYLLTSPRGNMAGIYECPYSGIEKALCLSYGEVVEAMATLEEMSFIKHDQESEYVWVIHQAEEELGKNPSVQQIIGMLNLLDRLEVDECAPFTDDLRHIILANPEYDRKLNLRDQLGNAGAL